MRNEVDSSPKLENCTFCRNVATVGGGMRNNAGGEPHVLNCTFASNCGQVDGGGIYTSEGSVHVHNSVFCKNWPNHIAGGWSDGGGNSLSPPCEVANVDNDPVGIVVGDLLILLANWGACP